MGCDLHMFVERKVGNVWEQVPEEKGIQHPYYSENLKKEFKDYFNRKTWSPGRNYALFGLLAGVRSAVFEPFIEPRGLPKDMSKGAAAEWEEWKDDGHNESYLTLPELLEHQDWIATVPCYLDVSQFKKFKKTGKVPDNYDYYPPRGSDVISNDEMVRRMKLAAFFDEKQYYTCIEHKVSYKEVSKDFWVDIVEAMKKLSDDPSEVRCVFWFDN